MVGEAAEAGEMKNRHARLTQATRVPRPQGIPGPCPHALACPLWAGQELAFPRVVPLVTSAGCSTPSIMG